MSNLTARIKVVLTALPTWLTALATVITLLAPAVAERVPAPWADDVSRWAITIAGWLTSAVVIIRNVTPASNKGVLSPTNPPKEG